MAHLADVSTEQLMEELRRRVECIDKPEKRVILVGASRRPARRARAAASAGLLRVVGRWPRIDDTAERSRCQSRPAKAGPSP